MKRFAEKAEFLMEAGGIPRKIVFLAVSGAALLADFFHLGKLPFNAAWIAIVLCGTPILAGALSGLLTRFDIKADVLVSMALTAAVFTGEIFAAGEVAFIMQLGALLEELTVEKARAGIEKLVRLTPQTARVIETDGSQRVVPAEEVKRNDRLRVLPGEIIPADGTILSGQSAVDQSVMTGESMPVDKFPGDAVSSGTVNQFGVFEMKALKVGEDSAIRRMVRLVQSADAGKAKITGVMDRWATWIVAAALGAAALTWLFSGEVIRAVTILVVFCPCALVLATPAAIMAAIGNAAKYGFLVREGDALERLSAVNRIAFDKTGTLTRGRPEVVKIKSAEEGITEEELYAFLASVEQHSEHPIGKAAVRCFREETGREPEPASGFRMVPGESVSAVVNGRQIAAGSGKMAEKMKLSIPEEMKNEIEEILRRGCTMIYIAADGLFAGYGALADTVRAESADTVRRIKALGATPLLITGDHENAAAFIGNQLKITEIHAGTLPEDKLRIMEAYQKQGEQICMVGDGINDAPALKKANVGIAMGGIGSDIAIDAADIVLTDDEIKELPHLLALSKKMMKTIQKNVIFAMGLNFAAVGLAVAGFLTPVPGALIHNAGSVVVIINSALLLKWKSRRAADPAEQKAGFSCSDALLAADR